MTLKTTTAISKTSAALLALALTADVAAGHGYMLVPPARAAVARDAQVDFDPFSVLVNTLYSPHDADRVYPAGNPWAEPGQEVRGDQAADAGTSWLLHTKDSTGQISGVCGSALFLDVDYNRPDPAGEVWGHAPVATYGRGEAVEIKTAFNADHGGIEALRLCSDPAIVDKFYSATPMTAAEHLEAEACFEAGTLRCDADDRNDCTMLAACEPGFGCHEPGKHFHCPPTESSPSKCGSSGETSAFGEPLAKHYVTIPSDFPVGRTILSWRWSTYENNEVFLSCADVEITDDVHSKAPTASRAPTPAPAPTAAPADDDQAPTGGCCFHATGADVCATCDAMNVFPDWCAVSEGQCGTCGGTWCGDAAADDGDGDGDDAGDDDDDAAAPTAAPSAAPTAAPTAACADDSAWFKKSKPSKDCAWVASKPEKRCSKSGDDGRDASEGCALTCGTCTPACVDDAEWFKKKKPSKDCEWVAKSADSRCSKTGEDGRDASDACVATCADHCAGAAPEPTAAPTPKPTPEPTTADDDDDAADDEADDDEADDGADDDEAGSCFAARDNGIWLGDAPFTIKGVSWFGGEELGTGYPHGLWSVSADSLLDFLVANGFNAIRYPTAIDKVLENSPITPQSWSNPWMDDDPTALGVLDAIVEKAAERDLLILLDMHRHDSSQWPEDGKWGGYGPGGAGEQDATAAWTILAERYKDAWNVMGADVLNEPHGSAWGGADETLDFNAAASRIGDAILAIAPHWLIFVEGVGGAPGWSGQTSTDNHWWGGNLEGALAEPVEFAVKDRLVYSPHVYGPSVFAQPYFDEPTFPANMPAIWDHHWGFIGDAAGAPPLVPGEWGGFYEGQDATWQDAMSDYFASKAGVAGSFYWSLNPNSGDTGGLLLDDWITPNEGKLAMLEKFAGTAAAAAKTCGGAGRRRRELAAKAPATKVAGLPALIAAPIALVVAVAVCAARKKRAAATAAAADVGGDFAV